VYAIRVVGLFGARVVYVGESHSGRLKKTIARHFQTWGRGKGWWAGLFRSSGTDPGRTYNRGACEVCFAVCHPSKARELQAKWIGQLHPADNVNETEDEDKVPF
jgi:hypothetical protein